MLEALYDAYEPIGIKVGEVVAEAAPDISSEANEWTGPDSQQPRFRGAQRKCFESSERSNARRRRHEIQVSLPVEEGRYEVVLLEASDEEAIRKTHARYFSSEHALIEDARTEIRAQEAALKGVASRAPDVPGANSGDT
jgi:hypothetical protein